MATLIIVYSIVDKNLQYVKEKIENVYKYEGSYYEKGSDPKEYFEEQPNPKANNLEGKVLRSGKGYKKSNLVAVAVPITTSIISPKRKFSNGAIPMNNDNESHLPSERKSLTNVKNIRSNDELPQLENPENNSHLNQRVHATFSSSL